MKKTIILFFCILIYLPSFACDICGCGVGSYYLGILPDFNKRFIGLRYQHKSMETHLDPNGKRTHLSENETYQSMEAWGAWNIGENMRVMAIIPYNFNAREIPSTGKKGKKQGLGDVAIMGYYKLFEGGHTTENYKLLIHSLWAGIGIKTPTGQYDPSEYSDDSPNNFQLGTASTDFMVNLAYDVRLMDVGLNLNVSYKFNTENEHDYRYGNKFTANALAYHKFNIANKLRIAPNAGLIYERQQNDVVYNRFDVTQSGGNSLTGVAGLEINAGKISIGGNYQVPLSQDLANGRAKAGNRLMTHVSFAF